jgi:iron(III) transport system substrate-binding protein
MKILTYLLAVALVTSIFLPIQPAFAQKSLPQVPITYPGDTGDTIIRRAQWIEGAKKEGPIALWTSGAPKEINQITAEFNKIYPFIKFDHWRGQDANRDTRLEQEHVAGRVSVDIFDAGEMYLFPRWRKMGILEKIIDIIPGIQKWDKRMYSKYGDWAAPDHVPKTPFYNTKLVSAAEAPKSWEDLLDPKWKGQMGMVADMRLWCLMALGEKGWGIEKTEGFLKRIKQQQPIWAAGHSAGLNLLIAGEYKIMVANSIRYIYRPQQEKLPVDWVRTSPVIVTTSAYVLEKKAPHPNAARLFLEWILSPKGLVTSENVTAKGAVFPGAGTRQSKLVEGLDLIYLNEEILMRANELGLVEKFAQTLGVTPSAD